MNHIGKRIKFLRQSKNMTQTELGEILGVKKAAVQKYEASVDPNLTADKIRLLCSTFGVYPRTFIYLNDYELWENLFAFWDYAFRLSSSFAKDRNDRLRSESPDKSILENLMGQNRARLMLAVAQLNDEGLWRVKNCAEDLCRIDEYRADIPSAEL